MIKTNCRLPRKLPNIVVKFQYVDGARDKFKNDRNQWFPMMELTNFTFFKKCAVYHRSILDDGTNIAVLVVRPNLTIEEFTKDFEEFYGDYVHSVEIEYNPSRGKPFIL